MDDLKKELVEICPQFDGYEMQDAHEFLISLLDAIKEEQTPKKPEGNPDESMKVEEDPIGENQVWSQIPCSYPFLHDILALVTWHVMYVCESRGAQAVIILELMIR